MSRKERLEAARLLLEPLLLEFSLGKTECACCGRVVFANKDEFHAHTELSAIVNKLQRMSGQKWSNPDEPLSGNH